MSVTFYEHADPAIVAKVQLQLAKLKPSCMDCGKTLTAKTLSAHVCSDHAACRLRRILSGPKRHPVFGAAR